MCACAYARMISRGINKDDSSGRPGQAAGASGCSRTGEQGRKSRARRRRAPDEGTLCARMRSACARLSTARATQLSRIADTQTLVHRRGARRARIEVMQTQCFHHEPGRHRLFDRETCARFRGFKRFNRWRADLGSVGVARS